jgi:hypothetical protein
MLKKNYNKYKDEAWQILNKPQPIETISENMSEFEMELSI